MIKSVNYGDTSGTCLSDMEPNYKYLIFFISTAFRFSLSFFMLSCPHLFIDDNLKKKN